MQDVGPTLVAMATKFGLGVEIQLPTGLSVILFKIPPVYLVDIMTKTPSGPQPNGTREPIHESHMPY